MSQTRTTIQEVQAEILDAVRKGQEAVADATKRWAGTIQSLAPSVPGASLPHADRLRTPEELVASAFDFAEHLLATQRSIAERLLHAVRPATPGQNGTTSPDGGPAGS